MTDVDVIAVFPDKHGALEMPPPPVPASDPKLASSVQIKAVTPPDETRTAGENSNENDIPSPRFATHSDNIFDVPPLAALQLLSAGIEALVRITGDVPCVQKSSSGVCEPTTMRKMAAEKEHIARKLSGKSLREQAQAQADADAGAAVAAVARSRPTTPQSRMPPTPPLAQPPVEEVDGVRLRTVSPNRQPEVVLAGMAGMAGTVIGENSQPLAVQHSAITRKFYSKKVPPISISEYLMRIHHFCPMSTGVYLATSLYIYRLAVADKAIAVTRLNAHRLLLAGLRVAMKALEDRSYPHAKIAKVGGVTESELARLEINFCFLAGFDLAVCADDMSRHWRLMKSGRAVGPLDQDGPAAVAAVMAQMGALPVRTKDRARAREAAAAATAAVRADVEGAS